MLMRKKFRATNRREGVNNVKNNLFLSQNEGIKEKITLLTSKYHIEHIYSELKNNKNKNKNNETKIKTKNKSCVLKTAQEISIVKSQIRFHLQSILLHI